MKQTRFSCMQEQMRRLYGPEQGERIAQFMEKEYGSLCAAFAERPEALQRHLHNNIFPVVTAFRALLAEGLDRQEAAETAQDAFLALMNGIADTIRRALRVPGLYRLIPWVFRTAMPRLFGEDAGFRFRFYPTDGHRAKFDMQQCPYFQICQELQCMELAPTFCETDDICYGNMHPRLIWNRTKTLARGGDCCDFDLYVKK